MYDELTEVDIAKMQAEVEYRLKELRPKLIEQVQIARGFGDLSENFEYKAAKQEKNRNDSRIRYLQNMIKTARVIAPAAETGRVSLFDRVTLVFDDSGERQEVQIVTTLRQNPLKGLLSKESPLGRALLGRAAGEQVKVSVNETVSYTVTIEAIVPGEDDASLDISAY